MMASSKVSGNETIEIGLQDFMIMGILGEGSFGKVCLCSKINGSDKDSLYAIKIVKKSFLIKKQKRRKRMRSERDILAVMRNSPFIARIAYAFETDDSVCLVLDYAHGGDLYQRLFCDSDANELHTLPEDKVCAIASEILIGLEELHKNKIVHRDIKLENILIDVKGHIVITDFGLSKMLFPHKKHKRAYSICGTTIYMAPEMLSGRYYKGYDFSVDFWSLGVLIFELLFGYTPFSDGEKNCSQTIKLKILNENFNIPENCSADARDLIQHLLNKNPMRRLGCGPLGIYDLKNHRFFKGINWDEVSNKTTNAPFDPCNFETERILKKLEPYHSSIYRPIFSSSYTYIAPGLHNSPLQMMKVEDNF